MNRKPDFFIVGAPKCGTTAMDHYLALHPEVFMARKEMHLFGADLRFAPQFYRRSPDAYLAEFASRNGHSRAGEASVWYLYSKNAAAEMKAFNPDARVIIMLRNPTEMLYSLYNQFRFDGNEHLPTFEEALAAEDDRRAGRRTSRGTYLTQGLLYRETVRYTEQVKRYFEVFGRDRVHIILYDDFAADIGRVYRAALEFLGVDTRVPAPTFAKINPRQSVKSSALRKILADPLVRRGVLAVRPWLPQMVFRLMQHVDAGLRRFNSRPATRAAMSPELRRRLKCEFAPEVERLGGLLGRDLTRWNEDGQREHASRQIPIQWQQTAAPARAVGVETPA